MKRETRVLVAMLGLAAMVAGGCASKEQVKSEEPVVPKAEVQKVEVAKPEPPKPVEVPKPVEQPKVEPKVEAPKMVESQAAKASAAVSFEAVYFDFDKSDLRQDARDVLYKNADLMLKAKPDANIQIEGHCDERGSAEYNLALGERRAKSALQYLITLGVKAERLSTISYGKEKPAAEGHDEAAWAKNRRAEFVVAK